MAKKLFGSSVKPKCCYCAYCKKTDDGFYCGKKGKVNDDDKCMRFKYDPLMRVPEMPQIPDEYTADDFNL